MEFHRTLLADTVGQQAFHDALQRAVRAGDLVLDLGAGLGLHAMFALQAGARHVFAVDRDDIIEAARQVCRDNGFADRITFLQASSAELDLPERVDVVVTNQSLFDMPGLLQDARERFLKPGGVLLPRALTLWCAPVTSESAFERTSFWKRRQFGFSFAAAHPFSVNKPASLRFPSEEWLGQGVQLARLDFSRCDGSPLSCKALLPLARPGCLHGIALWYALELADGVSISTDPRCDLPIKVWPSFFLPVAEEVAVDSADTVEFAFQMQLAAPATWTWMTTVRDSHGSQKLLSRHSDAFARPISPRRLRKRAQDYRPVRTGKGEAARVALENFDGCHDRAWLRQELQRFFPRPVGAGSAADDLLARLLDDFSE